jgi:hypothetical protein
VRGSFGALLGLSCALQDSILGGFGDQQGWLLKTITVKDPEARPLCHSRTLAICSAIDCQLPRCLQLQKDLQAMRTSQFGSAIEYFEQDLTARHTATMSKPVVKAKAALKSPAALTASAAAKNKTAPASTASNRTSTTAAHNQTAAPAAKPASVQSVNDTMFMAEAPGIATIQTAVSSWGIDRIDQVNLPLDGAYSPGNLDGSGVHGALPYAAAACHLHVPGLLSQVDLMDAPLGSDACNWNI